MNIFLIILETCDVQHHRALCEHHILSTCHYDYIDYDMKKIPYNTNINNICGGFINIRERNI